MFFICYSEIYLVPRHIIRVLTCPPPLGLLKKRFHQKETRLRLEKVDKHLPPCHSCAPICVARLPIRLKSSISFVEGWCNSMYAFCDILNHGVDFLIRVWRVRSSYFREYLSLSLKYKVCYSARHTSFTKLLVRDWLMNQKTDALGKSDLHRSSISIRSQGLSCPCPLFEPRTTTVYSS